MDGLDTALSLVSAGLAASGVGVLTTIIAAPVAIGLQAGPWASERGRSVRERKKAAVAPHERRRRGRAKASQSD